MDMKHYFALKHPENKRKKQIAHDSVSSEKFLAPTLTSR